MPRKFENLRRLESAVGRSDIDFTGRLVAVHALAAQTADSPEAVRKSTVDALCAVLHDARHRKETQILSLYRAAADPLAAVIGDGRAARSCRRMAADALHLAMRRGTAPARRAAAESLGGLPLSVRGPVPVSAPADTIPLIGWKRLFHLAAVPPSAPVTVMGRSRVFPAGSSRLLVVKTADSEKGGTLLAAEAAWMTHLAGRTTSFSTRFDIPEPLVVAGGHLFRLAGGGSKHPRRAIAFFASPGYFRYPNETGVDPGEMIETLHRCSWLLGRLTAMGIVHTAPIPLFHNRAQAWRREDRGRYEWPRGGRLDRWLSSSRHPNLAVSGLRDFEHLASIRRPGKGLYVHIGSHLLGLLLVGASYFRNRDPARVGFDEGGRPHDARDLFDPGLLAAVIRRVASGYMAGFAGRRSDPTAGMDPLRLAERMIEEMGVDRHMEETFRVADQKRLSVARFGRVLEEGGLCRDRIDGAVQGRRDIVLTTGPHLGGFNGRISIPELIEYVQRTAAECVCERFRKESEGQCSGRG